MLYSIPSLSDRRRGRFSKEVKLVVAGEGALSQPGASAPGYPYITGVSDGEILPQREEGAALILGVDRWGVPLYLSFGLYNPEVI